MTADVDGADPDPFDLLAVLERGDRIRVQAAGEELEVDLDATVYTPEFPPHHHETADGVDRIPAEIHVSGETDHGTPVAIDVVLDEDREALEPVARVNSVIDIQVPVRRRWRELGPVDELELLDADREYTERIVNGDGDRPDRDDRDVEREGSA